MDAAQKKELTEKMNKTLNQMEKELSGLRTGRASANLLDPVTVEVYGDKMSLSSLGTVSVSDSRTLTVQVWDKSNTKAVEKAIAEANLGLNPSGDGQVIRMTIPPLSEDRRKELVKLVYKYAENTKVALRNIRRDGMEELKKAEKDGKISKDDHRNFSTEIQKLTDEFIEKIDARAKLKEKEVLTV